MHATNAPGPRKSDPKMPRAIRQAIPVLWSDNHSRVPLSLDEQDARVRLLEVEHTASARRQLLPAREPREIVIVPAGRIGPLPDTKDDFDSGHGHARGGI